MWATRAGALDFDLFSIGAKPVSVSCSFSCTRTVKFTTLAKKIAKIKIALRKKSPRSAFCAFFVENVAYVRQGRTWWLEIYRVL